MNPHVASTALTLVNSTVQSLKTAIELAKTSKDSDLKQTISEVFNGVLDLKSKVLDLEEENRTLRIAIAEKAAIKRSAVFGYYFKDDENSPLCPKCYESDAKLAYLSNAEPWSGGIRRDCRICNRTYWEKPVALLSEPARSDFPF
ncbi:MAG TPA: hypothetical protein VMU57_22445 [Edaphobacter sp.]|uniref:hypothetical protein n=1 Tax=Edaphobacter sp. TaxID=1934404 RepID=UPI002BF3A065|nr:hypothetical protein [Edaphobacter sp.]HUZ97674.1 hypothetical protein [Edaphobacter sp.]